VVPQTDRLAGAGGVFIRRACLYGHAGLTPFNGFEECFIGHFLFLIMQHVLVTGANGFIGAYLVKQLISQEFFVIATGKGACRLPFTAPNLVYETLDFTNAGAVRNCFDKHRPAIIVHCGAMAAVDECELNREGAFLTNVTGTIDLLKQAAAIGSFFIFLSTDFVFDGNKGMYREEDETGPVNYYGQTKLLAEAEVKKYEQGWSIVRTVLVYGKPFLNRSNMLTNTAHALRKGAVLKIFDDQVRTPTYVEDLAGALVTIIEKLARGIYHISGGDVLTPYQMAVAVARHLNLDRSLVKRVSRNEWKQPAQRPLKTGFDISKAKKDLNYRPTSFEEGLAKTFEP
jgi:dTDP-4-dehydrorhamnose reductase